MNKMLSKCDRCGGDPIAIHSDFEDEVYYWIVVDRETGYVTVSRMTENSDEIEEGFMFLSTIDHPEDDPYNLYVCDECFQDILEEVEDNESWKQGSD